MEGKSRRRRRTAHGKKSTHWLAERTSRAKTLRWEPAGLFLNRERRVVRLNCSKEKGDGE